MHKLENYTLQKFLDSFVNELKRENEDREKVIDQLLNMSYTQEAFGSLHNKEGRVICLN